MTGGDAIAFLPATRLAALVRAREISPVEIVQAYLDRIDRFDGRLRGYITVCRESALEAARRAEARVVSGGPLGPLHGVPFAVKDQFDAAGTLTTVGSRVLAANVSSEDATTVARLAGAGGILLGKLNLTEFALGGTIDYPFGQPRNPWNPEHDTGGSSSGSGIAAAAGLCGVALGEDTGGSVRSPASCCGVVGLRPTWGRVSRHGSFPLCWSMDTPGPITRTVEDTALVLRVIAGHDPRDPQSSLRPVPDYVAALGGGVRGLRIGVITELAESPDAEDEVRRGVAEAIGVLGKLGAVVEARSLPLIRLAGAVFMAICDSEGAGLHYPWLKTRPADYDRGTRRRLLAASLLPSAAYHQAARARALLRGQVLEALDQCDLLACPTAHQAAPPIASFTGAITTREAAAGRFFTRRSFTSPASLAGIPAIAVPCGFNRAGLPLSLQLLGRPFDEMTVLRAAHAYESATSWSRRPPDLA
jgi:aspartyl-tRNA(Asn)/glutamyl-tRNA(Gln) amidotransferase subunit A